MSAATKPAWWPECPWPEEIWPMTEEQYVAAVPDENLRTAISGYLARFGWERAEAKILTAWEYWSASELQDAIDRSGFDVAPCTLCGLPVVCLPDGSPGCEKCFGPESEGE